MDWGNWDRLREANVMKSLVKSSAAISHTVGLPIRAIRESPAGYVWWQS